MKERLYTGIWGLGVRLRQGAKRAGVLDPLQPILLKLAPLLLRPPSREVEIHLPLGITMMAPPGFPSARTYAAGAYEPDVTRLINGTVKDSATVVDVGASVGYYTLLASRLVGASGRVYAFEADPKSYEYLVNNIEANGCGNVVAIEKAICATTGSGVFTLDEHGAEGYLSNSPLSTASRPSTVVETTTLDDFFRGEGWPSVDLIRMDIEGGELGALEGMCELSRRNPRLQLVMEFNLAHLRRAGASREALAAILTEMGFRNGNIIERGMKPFSVAEALPTSHATYNLLLTRE